MDIATLRRLAEVERLSIKEMAERTGVTPQVVIHRLRKWRIDYTPGTTAKHGPEVESKLRHLFEVEELTTRQIAERLGMTMSQVTSLRNRFGIDYPANPQPHLTRNNPYTQRLSDEKIRALYAGRVYEDVTAAEARPHELAAYRAELEARRRGGLS